jgi:hypothetical protein
MLEVLQRCFKAQLDRPAWQQRLRDLLPSIEGDPQQDSEVLLRMRERNDAILDLPA